MCIIIIILISKEAQLLTEYVQQKKALELLREQELHSKKMKLVELQISEAEWKDKLAQYLYENRRFTSVSNFVYYFARN